MDRRKLNYLESDNSSDEDYTLEDDTSFSKGNDGSTGSLISQEPQRKRGRGPSKHPCTNRNALMARVNRQRKKEYVEKIENQLASYRKGNQNLANVIQQQSIDLKRLTAEVAYLKNVLNNNTTIQSLLRTMNESLMKSKGRPEEDKWDSEKFQKTKVEATNGFNSMDTFKLPDSSTQGFTCDPSSKGSLNLATESSNVNVCPDDTQIGISDVDIDQLGDFNYEISDIPAYLDGYEGIDLFKSDQPDNIFDNLDNSGICLHVNSGRISLEYCSICHLNSINSDDP